MNELFFLIKFHICEYVIVYMTRDIGTIFLH